MDAYDRKARLYPAACVVLPLTMLALLLLTLPKWWTGLLGFLIAGGLHVPVMFAIRDLGARKQTQLWKLWGGTPTTVRMRWASAENTLLHARNLDDVQRATGIAMPDQSAEATNPEQADAAYDAATRILREKTRSGTDYPLVKTEVTNYGYRRNLYGCRPIGIGVALLAAAAEMALAVLAIKNTVDVSVALMFGASGLSLAWIAWWAFWVTPNFVRRDADRYADALIASAGSITPPSQ